MLDADELKAQALADGAMLAATFVVPYQMSATKRERYAGFSSEIARDAIGEACCRLRHLETAEELIATYRRLALEAFGSRITAAIRQASAVTLN